MDPDIIMEHIILIMDTPMENGIIEDIIQDTGGIIQVIQDIITITVRIDHIIIKINIMLMDIIINISK